MKKFSIKRIQVMQAVFGVFIFPVLICMTACTVRDGQKQVEKEEIISEQFIESEVEGEVQIEENETNLETKEEAAAIEETESIEILNIPAWITASDVNFRTEPDLNCEVLQRLGRNTQILFLYEKEGWGAVEYNGIEGYVSMDYLTTEEPKTNGYVVVIDPGHQKSGDSTKEPNGPESSVMKARVTGGTSGCTTGVMEYELNLSISLKLRDELETRGYIVYMTRETHDVNISNMERAQYATSVGADISVRIHANGSENSSVSGALALAPSSSNPYISGLSAESQDLGKCILDAYCATTGMNNQGVVSSDTMTGINWSTVPVTILEMGYMTNSTDDTNMEDAVYQQNMVQGIANGIDNYFGLGQ